MGRRAGVLGHPISHSLSPALHRAAYAALGLDWEYDAYDVESGGLAAFLERVDKDWGGLSLTMPLKVEAIPLMDFIEPEAKRLGVINTVLVGGRAASRQLVGANTDVHGIVAALGEAGVTELSRATIVGGGATAVSAMAAFAHLGCKRPFVVVRSRARAGGLLRAASSLGVEPVWVDMADAGRVTEALSASRAAVSTIPAAAGASLATACGEPVLTPEQVLLDVVYDPLVTPLAAAWLRWGGTRVGGERMLLHQAGEQVRLMTHHVAPLDAMSQALSQEMATRA